MTYNVFGGMLNLTQSINQSLFSSVYLSEIVTLLMNVVVYQSISIGQF